MVSFKGLFREQLTEADAIKFLEDKGYLITRDVNPTAGKTNAELIDHFYKGLKKYTGVNVLFSGLDDKEDIKALQRFQNKARRFFITKDQANEYLLAAFDNLFYNHKELNIRLEDLTIRFLLSDKGSWIFNKLRKFNATKLSKSETSEEVMNWKNSLYETEDERLKELRQQRAEEILGEYNGKESKD